VTRQFKYQPENNPGLRGLKRFCLLMALLITCLLAFRFGLMLYFPGTEKTASLFRLLFPHWKAFGNVCLLLKSPVAALVALLPVQTTAGMKGGFPDMPASLLIAWLTHQPLAAVKAQYPGQAEWLTLMAIPFWNGLLLMIYQGGCYLSKNMNFSIVLQESRTFLAERRLASQAAGRVEAGGQGEDWLSKVKISPKISSPDRSPDISPDRSNDEPKPEQPLDAHMQDRLTQAKSQAAPPVIIRPTMADWEQYKQEQGDLMVNQMVRQLRQENANLHARQDNLRTTFSKYFSPKVLQYLESNRGTFENVNNEKHQMSVMFCDIRGFSTYSQSASADEVMSLLSEYFEITSHAILNKHNGVINKLMGDGLMAYWGFPVPTENHAYIATCAALDILNQIEYRNKSRSDQPPLNIGIGIATGEAIVGNIGSSDFKDFTLIGPVVNMTSRLEEANKTLNTRLLISQATYQGLKGNIPCRDCGKIEIRGWQEPQQVYAPIIKP
jgi:class 3 adenylate cyclase